MFFRTSLSVRSLAALWIGPSALLALALAAACSSSSGNASSPGDSGTSGEAAPFSPVSDSGGTSMGINAMCGQLATATGGGEAGTCPAGQSCCTTLSIASLSVTAACVANGQCSGGVSNECQSTSDCPSGNVCCAGVAASADASAATGGGFAGFSIASFNTTCQVTCQTGQTENCASDTECPTGELCQSIALLAGDAGVGGAAGAMGYTIPKTCAVPTPDAGSTPIPEAGPEPEAASPANDAAAE
jgi:hypothetical protein